MFDNLTKEIFDYSVIPVAVIVIIVLILLVIGKKKDNNYFKYNYFIKILLLIIIGLVLPLITGYTIWKYEKYSIDGTLSSNIIYMILLVMLIILLIILLIVICNKLLKGIKKDETDELENTKKEELND